MAAVDSSYSTPKWWKEAGKTRQQHRVVQLLLKLEYKLTRAYLTVVYQIYPASFQCHVSLAPDYLLFL